VDDYKQDHYQLFYSSQLSKNLTLNTALHYTRGKGFYEEFKEDQKLSNYNMSNVVIENTTISRSDLIRRKWLDNHFYGTVFSLDYQSNSNFGLTVGGGLNRYLGNHYGEVIWAKYSSNSNIRHRYYDNDADKTDYNLYTKFNFQPFEKVTTFLDLQIRGISYSYLGLSRDVEGNPIELQQSKGLNFFNPKAGLTYSLNTKTNLYASVAIGNKEPNRSDYVDAINDQLPKPEQLTNLEAGFRKTISRGSVSANYYLMYYKDQLVLTGKINDVGNYIRTNIDKSYRSGLELTGKYSVSRLIAVEGNATFSSNKVLNYTEFFDNYDSGEQEAVFHKKADIAFSPNITAFGRVNLEPVKNLNLSLTGKYVGRQYLDNTGDKARALDAFFVSDFKAAYSFKTNGVKRVDVLFSLNNWLNALYEPNGYTFSYIYEGEKTTENYYYPQAGRNFMLGLNLKF
jgi:iron complex outermembrane recepter protein